MKNSWEVGTSENAAEGRELWRYCKRGSKINRQPQLNSYQPKHVASKATCFGFCEKPS